MNLSMASASPLRLEVNGRKFEMDRLDMRDLAAMEQAITDAGGPPYVPVPDLYQWAQTAGGAPFVLMRSRLHRDPAYTAEQTVEFGSLVTQSQLAAALVAASITNGEEGGDDASSGKKKAANDAMTNGIG